MTNQPKYSTIMLWARTHWEVQLLFGNQVVAQMSLDEWMELGAVKAAADELMLQQLPPRDE